MLENWMVYQKKADFALWARELGIDPVVARVIRNRGVETLEEARRFLCGTLEDMHSPWALPDMERAVSLLLGAVQRGERIRVIGDYDVDGVTSAVILTKGIRLLGGEADAAIPHRIRDGYGLSDGLVRDAAEEGADWIVTCDNGIAAPEQIRLANELGLRVIVTDHHEVPFRFREDGSREELLPEAAAIVNPKRAAGEGSAPYPFPGICGAMVAYKVMCAAAERSGSGNLRSALGEFLELAAFGTVCDVMELQGENRIAVREGLRRMRETENAGLKALMRVAKIAPERLCAYHLGFILGPCVNATGRLDTARRALDLLLCDSFERAVPIAEELAELNESRKALTTRGVEQAIDYVNQNALERQKVWVLYLPQVHESIAGIIAGRIKEKYFHPVLVLTRAEDGGVKGSGRSIEAYHMFDALAAVQSAYAERWGGRGAGAGGSSPVPTQGVEAPECAQGGGALEGSPLFTKFGGHAMAAGLSMDSEEKVEILRELLNASCTLAESDFTKTLRIDVPMPLSYAGPALAEQLELLEPCGVGNPGALFAQKDVRLVRAFRFGSERQYTRLQALLENGRKEMLVWFHPAEELGAFLDAKYGAGSFAELEAGRRELGADIAYRVGRNTYRGETYVEYKLEAFR